MWAFGQQNARNWTLNRDDIFLFYDIIRWFRALILQKNNTQRFLLNLHYYMPCSIFKFQKLTLHNFFEHRFSPFWPIFWPKKTKNIEGVIFFLQKTKYTGISPKKISEKKQKISVPASRFMANSRIKRGYQTLSIWYPMPAYGSGTGLSFVIAI